MVPGPPRDSTNYKAGKGREGKGRKEGKERGREEAGVRRGKERACGADGSMDRWTEKRDRAEGGREGWGAVKIRRGNATKESHGQQWLQFV
jgi:hypothetical protein